MAREKEYLYAVGRDTGLVYHIVYSPESARPWHINSDYRGNIAIANFQELGYASNWLRRFAQECAKPGNAPITSYYYTSKSYFGE